MKGVIVYQTAKTLSNEEQSQRFSILDLEQHNLLTIVNQYFEKEINLSSVTSLLRTRKKMRVILSNYFQ